jgi:hypothetical protein
MSAHIEAYSYLWDGSQPGWVLLKAPALESGYCIFNVSSSTLLHVDDEELNTALCNAMIEAGRPIIDDLPGQPANVGVSPA